LLRAPRPLLHRMWFRPELTEMFPVNCFYVDAHKRLKCISIGVLITLRP